MDLKDLKKEIPFKWRVQSASKHGASCVAYIDARDVQDLLDEVCEPECWQVRYEEHKGNLFANIGIFYTDVVSGHSEWVWKSDCGTESNVEKQKGEASDAFKRAAVMWGIGRFLYSKKIVKIKEVGENNGKYFPTKGGQRIWDITKYCNNLQPSPPKEMVKGNLTQPIVEAEVKSGKTIDQIKALYHVDEKQEKKLIKMIKEKKDAK